MSRAFRVFLQLHQSDGTKRVPGLGWKPNIFCEVDLIFYFIQTLTALSYTHQKREYCTTPSGLIKDLNFT